MQNPEPTLFDSLPCEITLDEVFDAYFSARKNKRGTINSINFELDYERNIINLWKEINNKTYKPGRSITFIIKKPVQREIFAADFRDRVVHHLIIHKLLPIFEHNFNPHSYSCRIGKGTLFGIKDVYNMIKECSDNYTSECYVMKLDIQAFFMHIDQRILFARLQEMLDKYYIGGDKDLLLFLISKTVFNSPQHNCLRKGKKSDWNGLPKTKSLFYADVGKGVPIGNLTSQIFANFYLNNFDSFVSNLDSGIKYGRYVDDFIMIHKDKNLLIKWRNDVKDFLQKDALLTLHPDKFYLQSYRHGLAFIGVFMLPYRIYAGRRLKGNMFAKLKYYMDYAYRHRINDKAAKAIAVCNSYFGFLRHHNTAYLRKRAWNLVKKRLGWFAYCSKPYLSLNPFFYTSEQCDMKHEICRELKLPRKSKRVAI